MEIKDTAAGEGTFLFTLRSGTRSVLHVTKNGDIYVGDSRTPATDKEIADALRAFANVAPDDARGTHDN